MGVPPPQDSSAPEDDNDIPNEMLLYRLVSRYEIVLDNNLGRHRPTSNAFQKTTGTNRMSVLLDDALRADGREAIDLVDDLRTAASFSVGFVRSECNEGVIRQPEPDEPAHGNVVGTNRGSTAERRIREKLAREASCVEGDWGAAKSERS